jgi:glycolate oxidase iron-sulfur subunit
VTSAPTPAAGGFPLDLADRCVKCGLCLPHCPTYRLAGVEGESPRGRIALMQGLATGALEPGPELVRHLDQCLACRACERVCPAGVPYGELLDEGRALLARRGHTTPPLQRALRAVVTRPALLRRLAAVARMPGVAGIARRVGGIAARAVAILPPRAGGPAAAPTTTPPHNAPGGEALLFTGCVGAALDGRSLRDTARLLAAAGWRVRIPERQVCCGAVDLHGGRPARARELAKRNLAAFSGAAPIVACASGCGATLLEYGRLPGAAAFAARVTDPASLLAEARLEFGEPPFRRLALHVPCTQRNVTRTAGATRELLARLPGVAVVELAEGCCGAAGEMFLTRPSLSDRLLDGLLDALERDLPDVLVTSNIGCALHFGAGLRRRGLDLPVLHPASLVLRSLAPSGGGGALESPP